MDPSPSSSPEPSSKAGYLYAVHGGFWPNPDGVFQLRVKLGSFRTADPVASMVSSYQRSFGHPQLLWTEPSADAYTDETGDLFVALAAHRVWPKREVFVFADLEECLEVLDHWSHGFRRRTEGADKPRTVIDLVNPWLPQQRLEEDRTARKRARLELREEQAEQQRKERRRDERNRDEAVTRLIKDECELGAEYMVKVTEFNTRAAALGGHDVGKGMQCRGFAMKKHRVGGRLLRFYVGIRLANVSD